MASEPSFIHPSAIVETDSIGDGTRVWAFAHVLRDVRIGRNCNIGDHVFIENDVVIGEGCTIKNGAMIWRGVTLANYVFVGPGAVFTNDRYPRSPRLPGMTERYRDEGAWLAPTRVEEGASIGANATIVCGVTLGAYCAVAAGSVVTADVPAFALVCGAPARVTGRVDREGRVCQRMAPRSNRAS